MAQINTAKLEALGLEKAKAACVIHAMAAIKASERKDEAAFIKHSDLLDQCAAVGRKIIHGEVNALSERIGKAATALRCAMSKEHTSGDSVARWSATDIV